MICEVSLIPDRMNVPHLNKCVNLTPKDRHKYEKKGRSIRDLTGNEKTVDFERARVGNYQ